MQKINDNAYANCKISMPILYPDNVQIKFNGLAWSNIMGMIHEVSDSTSTDWETWLGTRQ